MSNRLDEIGATTRPIITGEDGVSRVNLAETGPEERLQERFARDRGPSTRTATGSWVNWGSQAELLGQPFDSAFIPLSKLEQMRRDPILAFGLMFCKVPLVRAKWRINCADPRIAAAVDNALRPVYGRFILAYLNSLDYGFSPMVKRFKLEKPNWTYEDGDGNEQPVWPDKMVNMITWRPFLALNPRGAEPNWTKKGDFNGINLTSAGTYGVGRGASPFGTSGYGITSEDRPPDIPLDWAMWATNEKDSVFGSLWGYPRIGYAYRFWWAYWYRFGLADRAFEKWGDPPVKVFHPAETGVNEAGERVDYGNEALAIAEALRSGANVAMPTKVAMTSDARSTQLREWDIEQMEHKVDFSSLNEAFEYLDVQKLRAMFVPEQALIEGKGGTSSRNVADTFGDLFQQSQVVAKEEIDDQLNRYVIKQFVDINFGADAPPATIHTFGFDPVDVEVMEQMLQLIGQQEDGARRLRSKIDWEEILERLNIPTVSASEARKALEQAVEEAAAAKPPDSSPEGFLQIGTRDGVYFKGRESLVLALADEMDAVNLSEQGEESEPTWIERWLMPWRRQQEAAISDLGEKVERIGIALSERRETVTPINVNLNQHPQSADVPDVNVNVEAPEPTPPAEVKVDVHVPEQRPSDVKVDLHEGETPVNVDIHVPPQPTPDVKVELHQGLGARLKKTLTKIFRDEHGDMTGSETTEEYIEAEGEDG